MSTPHADLSVRPALAGDEEAITGLQLAAWAAPGSPVPATLLARLDQAAVRASWRMSITAPPAPGCHVLVACAGPRTVGFAAVAACSDAGSDLSSDPRADGASGDGAAGLIVALEVAPTHCRAGHASRLLAACVDVLRADGVRSVQTWVPATDDARARFLTAAGLAPDGGRRDLVAPDSPADAEPALVEHRWSATI